MRHCALLVYSSSLTLWFNSAHSIAVSARGIHHHSTTPLPPPRSNPSHTPPNPSIPSPSVRTHARTRSATTLGYAPELLRRALQSAPRRHAKRRRAAATRAHSAHAAAADVWRCWTEWTGGGGCGATCCGSRWQGVGGTSREVACHVTQCGVVWCGFFFVHMAASHERELHAAAQLGLSAGEVSI